MRVILLMLAGLFACGTSAFAQEASTDSAPRVLVAFFSKTNNTGTVAEQVHSRVGGDIFRVEAKKQYPREYRQTTEIARAEQDNNERPELAATISPEDMKNYDVIFLGYPIWWGTMPMVMFTFLEQYDLSGKTIVPFCTHGGSGLSRSPTDIGRLAPGATLRQGLAIRGGAANQTRNDVDNWLRQLGFIQ